jgi:uncharacterized protein (DUF1330 family)
MVVIRCTQRLLKRSRVVPDPATPEPSAILGEWYANVMALPFRGESAVLFCSVETRIVVITHGSTLRTTMPQFAERLVRLLDRLGVPEEAIELQRAQMADGIIAATNDRSMLGSLNDVAHAIRASAERFQSLDSLDFDHEEEKLAGMPHVAADIFPSIALASVFERAGFTMRPVEGVVHHEASRAPVVAAPRSKAVPPRAHAPVPKRATESRDEPAQSHGVSEPLVVVATLTVRRAMHDRFREYEKSAVRIMAKYGGSLERTVVEENGDGETIREVHLLRFPSRQAFDAYNTDSERLRLSAERNDVIVATEIVVGHEGPSLES